MLKFSAFLKITFSIFSFILAAGSYAQQPPSWGEESNPSPSSDSGSSKNANKAADKAMYKPVNYVNTNKPGPSLVVIPGDIKSSNVGFTQKFGPNNIADFAELELSKANFKVIERADIGPILKEFQLAYSLGDPEEAKKLKKGKLKTTKWIVKFDILKAEPVASSKKGFNGQAFGSMIGIFGRGTGAAAGETVVGSVETSNTSGVWIIGMRYKILDANTTEQVATGYTEEKMELGSKSTSVMGISESSEGGLTLDTMVQRLVQKSVWEIDSKYK